MPKAAVLDPQGNAVRDAMQHLGMPEVRSVRIGKYMEIDIDGQKHRTTKLPHVEQLNAGAPIAVKCIPKRDDYGFIRGT